MHRRALLLSTLLLGAGLALAGCKSVGEQLGSAVGGAVGSSISGYAASTGSVVGSVIGGEIADALDPESQQLATTASQDAIETGQPQTWSNPKAGTSGEVKVVEQKQEQKTVEVQVLKDKVQELPPIEVIGKDYVATAEANVRGGPGTDYKSVGALAAGTTVNVVGKVKGKDWFMVSQNDVIVGYVASSLLAPATTPSAPPAIAFEGTVAKEAVSADVTCRTAEHQVRLANGEIKTETIDACQTTDGWQSSTRPSAGGGTNGGTARPT